MFTYRIKSTSYLEIANYNLKRVDENLDNIHVVIVFSVMYIEAVINELIFNNQLDARLHKERLDILKDSISLDIYNERKSLEKRMKLIFEHYKIDNYMHDIEYVELFHLISIRSALVHLKPIIQSTMSNPDKIMCKKALNYLFKSKKIIRDPFAKGVFWIDAIMRKEVGEWALEVTRNSVKYLYEKTHDRILGNVVLVWHDQIIDSKNK